MSDRSSPLLAWLPFLWSRVLFPAPQASSTVMRLPSLLILIVLPALLLYPTLSFRLLEPDEGRYAQIPREMLARGDWVVPHLQGEPYLDKPPLLYWLVMLSYSVFGDSTGVPGGDAAGTVADRRAGVRRHGTATDDGRAAHVLDHTDLLRRV